MSDDFAEKLANLIAQVRKYEAEGDYSKAAHFCSEAAFFSPDDLSLVVWLGWIYFNDKRYEQAINCAKEVLSRRDETAVSALKLLVFSCGQIGSWELASVAFEELKNISPKLSMELATEANGSFWDYIQSKHAAGMFSDVTAAYEKLPSDLTNLSVGNVYDIKLMAANAYLNQGESLRAANALKSRSTELADRRMGINPKIPFSEITLITSIMPTREEVQSIAVKSWCDYGAKVFSLNSSDEIELLRETYPNVTFFRAPRDASKNWGKPYVYLSDMMTVLAQAETDVVGIINSDIVLRSTNDIFLQSIYHEARNSMIYGHRRDVKDVARVADGLTMGSLFIDGIDWFFFPKKFALALSKQPFIFGCPMWDLWLPIQASSLGIPMCMADGLLAYHEEHVQRWDSKIFSSLGMQLVENLAASNYSNAASYTARQMANFAKSCSATASGKLDDARLVGRFADLIKSLIKIEARVIKG